MNIWWYMWNIVENKILIIFSFCSLMFVRGGFSCHATCRNEIGWSMNWTFEGTGVEPKIQPKAQK